MTDGQHLIFDDPKDIECCLNCKQPTCPGVCSKMQHRDKRRTGEWYRLEEFMTFYNQGLDDDAIAKMMGMSTGSIVNRRQQLKLKRNRGL